MVVEIINDLTMLLLQVIFKQLFLWLPWDLIMSLQRSRAMRCSSSPIWCLRYMERCRISPLHLCRQMSFDADIVLMFWLDLFPGQLYCGGGESKAKVWTAGERENGEHQIGDLIKSILDWIGVTNVTFRMIQKTHCFFGEAEIQYCHIWDFILRCCRKCLATISCVTPKYKRRVRISSSECLCCRRCQCHDWTKNNSFGHRQSTSLKHKSQSALSQARPSFRWPACSRVTLKMR